MHSFWITLTLLSLVAGPVLAKKPVFRPIRGEEKPQAAEAESLYITPNGSASAPRGSAPAAAEVTPKNPKFVSIDEVEEPSDVRYFEDLPGETISGIPRVVRDNNGTEIFFTNVNQSYFIRQDNFHNRRYFPFEAAIKSGQSISFRADPISRQILEVDGVEGASAKPKPKKQPASVPAESNSLVDKNGSK